MCNVIADEANPIINTSRSEKGIENGRYFQAAEKIFVRSKTDDVTGHETDEEQPDTTNMLDLESEEYA